MPAAAARALAHAARLNGLGLQCKAAGRYPEARAFYERALRALHRGAAPDPDALAVLYHNLAGIAYACGDFEAGETLARAGLALRLTAKADARGVAADLVALAAILDGQGRFDEAEHLYLIGLDILRRLPTPDHEEIAVALNGLGTQYAERGHLRAAVRLLRRSAGLKRAVLGPRHQSLRLTLHNLRVARQRLQAEAGRGDAADPREGKRPGLPGRP